MTLQCFICIQTSFRNKMIVRLLHRTRTGRRVSPHPYLCERVLLSTSATSPDDSSRFHYYEPKKGHGLSHNPFNSIIAPRPIGWIATKAKEGGTNNLAPYSFFNAFNYHPPIIGFSSIGFKDTLKNVTDTHNFTWNLVTRELSEQMNKSSDPLPPDEDEFLHAGVTPTPSTLISSPRVRESPVSFECKLTQIVQLSGESGKLLNTWLVLGEVVAVHIDKKLITEGGTYDTLAAFPITRGGGAADYFQLGPDSLFLMDRPSK